MVCPVMYDDMSLANHTHVSAISEGFPPLFKGIEFLHSSTTFSSNTYVISVSINPGAITLHLIFLDPSSKAIDLENPIIPAFDAA